MKKGLRKRRNVKPLWPQVVPLVKDSADFNSEQWMFEINRTSNCGEHKIIHQRIWNATNIKTNVLQISTKRYRNPSKIFLILMALIGSVIYIFLSQIRLFFRSLSKFKWLWIWGKWKFSSAHDKVFTLWTSKKR